MHSALPRLSVTLHGAEDGFALTALDGVEALSSFFLYDLDLRATRPGIARERLLGAELTIRVEEDGTTWHRHGVIARCDATGPGRFRARLVPALWWLTWSADRRLFQQASPPAIAATLLDEFAIEPTDWRLARTHIARDTVAQFDESAFDLLSRLLRQAGIAFFFRSDAEATTLVLADCAAGLDPADPAIAPRPDERAWFHTAFRVEARTTNPLLRSSARRDGPPPQDALTAGEIAASCPAWGPAPGQACTLPSGEDAVITRVRRRIAADTQGRAWLRARPLSAGLILPLAPPRPCNTEAHPARVLEAADTDQRILLRFAWNRPSPSHPDATARVRLAPGWTTSPRPGDPVLVTFAHGNPDQPLVAAPIASMAQAASFALAEDMLAAIATPAANANHAPQRVRKGETE
jgi:uncharacterized protein involved in type VI secretion and phage assembly